MQNRSVYRRGMAQPRVVMVYNRSANGQACLTPIPYGLLSIPTLSWGLGYFGMPHVLLKFMAINKPDELTMSRRIAVVWVIISLTAAVGIGIIGRVLFPAELLTQSQAENIFVIMSMDFFVPFIAGIVMAGILAATISSSDSYLLKPASALSKNIYQGIIKKEATDKQVLPVSRITLLIVALVAIIIALNSVIFRWFPLPGQALVLFGPIILSPYFGKELLGLLQ